MLERLEQYGSIGSNRPPVRLGGRRPDEANGVRIPVDLELEARLAVTLATASGSRARGPGRPAASTRSAARLVHPRARQLQQLLGDLRENGSHCRSPRRSTCAASFLRQVTGDDVQDEPARAHPARGVTPDPALDGPREPLGDVGRDLAAPGSARARPARTARSPPRAAPAALLGLPVEAPPHRPHSVNDVRRYRNEKTTPSCPWAFWRSSTWWTDRASRTLQR